MTTGDWQLIESVPKDGSLVLLFAEDGFHLGCLEPDYKFWDWENDETMMDAPTHWMPLPPIPDGYEEEA